MSYLTRQAVRKEAGFQEVETEALAGVTDGVNASFAASRTPIVDNTNDDVLGATDVLVRVNGVPVAVTSVDGATGVIVLAAAPAADSEVTCQYASSALTDSDVDELRTEAESLVNAGLRKFITVPLSPESDHFPAARRIAKLYAGGFALIRDYGKNADTEESGKDGYAKVSTARKLLEELIGNVKDGSASSSSGGSAKVISEGHPLSDRRTCDTTSHNFFMRKEC